MATRQRVYLDELIDADEVAAVLGVAGRNVVSTYQRRYPNMPRPVIDRGGTRLKLWLRPDIEAWARGTGRR